MHQAAGHGNPTLVDATRRTDWENLVVGLWLALLIGAGCWLLNALAESALREECLMRGAALCVDRSQPRAPVPAKRKWIANYLKNSRNW